MTHTSESETMTSQCAIVDSFVSLKDACWHVPIENPQLDESVWQAWVDKNARKDRKYFFKVKVYGAISLVLALGLLLWKVF